MTGNDHFHRARQLLSTDPAAALEHASAAISTIALDCEELPSAVVVLAETLEQAGMFGEIVELVTACQSRFPHHVELRLRLGLAAQKLGRPQDMIAAFEACLAIGDNASHPHTAGAGTYLPLHQLGLFAESQGDARGARQLYNRAMMFADHEPTADRLAFLETMTGHVRAALEERPVQRKKPTAAVAKRPLTVVACIPGREFSGRFFDAWNEFVARCHAIGVNLVISRRYDAVVYYARNKVVGGDVRRGPKQAPWGGELDYDFMLWIDSDVIFRFEDFQALLKHNVDMVAGLYLMADNARFAAVEKMNEDTFKQNGEFEFLTPAKTAKHHGLIPVDYCGFGFVLVRRGVFEKVEYPWFRPIYIEMGECSDFTAEDVGFCMLAKKAGIQMMIDPNVVVGHEKHVVLQPPAAKAKVRAA